MCRQRTKVVNGTAFTICEKCHNSNWFPTRFMVNYHTVSRLVFKSQYKALAG
jgi:hypothetical protein